MIGNARLDIAPRPGNDRKRTAVTEPHDSDLAIADRPRAKIFDDILNITEGLLEWRTLKASKGPRAACFIVADDPDIFISPKRI
jgi:hypothetical protein